MNDYAQITEPYWASLRMIREAIETIFGPAANLESEEAELSRGPEPHHTAEAIIAALQNVAAEIERLTRELDKISALLKDPAAVRVNYLRGDIACQNLIAEARRKALEEAADIIRARMPLYTEDQALNACRECISSIRHRAQEDSDANS